MELPLVPSMLVGSYAQPGWLIDRERLNTTVPRVRRPDLWRVPEPYLSEAVDDATVLAVHDQVRAGVDVVTDGEMRRESYFNRFAGTLEGIDHDHPGTATNRLGTTSRVPRVAGPLRRTGPSEADSLAVVMAHTDLPVKVTLPGPFTLSILSQDDFYGDPAALAMAYAEVVNEEVLDLFARGAAIVQLDEPYVQANPVPARRYAVAAINRALAGAPGRTALHVCFGYGVMIADKPDGYACLAELDACAADDISIEAAQPRLDLAMLDLLPSKRVAVGVLDLADHTVETPEVVVARLVAALDRLGDPARLIAAPDCGLKHLPRDVAYGKLSSLAEAARRVRAGLEPQ